MKIYLKKLMQNNLVRWQVMVDDEDVNLKISTNTKRFFRLKEGENNFFKSLDLIVKYEDREITTNFFNYLAKREHSLNDAEKWLNKRHISKKVSEKLINYALEKNFLNYQRYADFFLRHHEIKGNKPFWQLKKELELSGIDLNKIKNIEFDEKQALKNYILKKNLLKYDKNKIIRKLQMRGFNYNLIENVLEDLGNYENN